jgi:hypothetical protein
MKAFMSLKGLTSITTGIARDFTGVDKGRTVKFAYQIIAQQRQVSCKMNNDEQAVEWNQNMITIIMTRNSFFSFVIFQFISSFCNIQFTIQFTYKESST